MPPTTEPRLPRPGVTEPSPETHVAPLARLGRILSSAHLFIGGLVVTGLGVMVVDRRSAQADHLLLAGVNRERVAASDLLADIARTFLLDGASRARESEELVADIQASIERLRALDCDDGQRHEACNQGLFEAATTRALEYERQLTTALASQVLGPTAIAKLNACHEAWLASLTDLDASLEAEHDAHRASFARLLMTLASLLLAGLGLQWCGVIRPALRAANALFLETQRREREHRRLALVAQRTDNSVIVADRDGRIEWVNAGFERITGFGHSEVVGLALHELVRSERADAAVLAELGDARASGRTFQGELWNRAKSGREYIIQTHMQPLRDDDGAVTGFMLMDRDVTEERQLARELEERERHFRLLVESTHVIVWEFDPELDRFTYIAPQIERYGHTVEEWMRPGFWMSRLHPDDREVASRCFSEALRRRVVHRFQYRMNVPTGTAWIDDIVSVSTEGDGKTLLRGVFIDVTHQKEAERELEELTDLMRVEAERLELALTGGEIGLWDWNPIAETLHVNDRWARMVGVELDELTGTSADFEARCHPDDLVAARAAMRRHVDGETETYEALYRLRHVADRWVWTLGRGKVVNRDTAGRPTRVVGTQLDKTAEVERQAELEALRRGAEDANRTKSEFLAKMSHEIRTPLTAILGYADILREDDQRVGPEARLGMIDTIRSAGQHLLTIINDVLDLSKIEADRMTVEAIDTDIAGMLVDVVRMLTPRASEKGIGLALELTAPAPTSIVSDPTRLRQIVMNLLGNAVKFTEEGRVTLRVRTASEGRLVLEIDDTGPGMTPEQQERLFRPFIQADGSVTRKFGGTGLGLTISRRLARLMGGEVRLAASAPGRGSCFALEIPLVLANGATFVESIDIASPRAANEVATSTQTLTGRILLVEDGPMNQRLIRTMLAKAGAEVTVANHGLHALELLDAARASGGDVDLVLTDMQMPEMDGYTLARTLRERGERLPIVALTAHAMAEDRQRCIDAGCDGYATKPIDRSTLLETCTRLLARDAATRREAA